MSGDDPPYLPVGTDVSAKYKGAFCEAKVSKVVRVLQLKVTYVGSGLGTGTVTDEQIRFLPSGSNNQSSLLPLRVGQTVQVKHPEKKEYVNATINRIRDCSQYTVVFDDGDITTLRRTALCLKSGRHFNESETLDQLPLTHPEHFGNPVVGGRRGRRSRQLKEDSSDEGEDLDDMELDRSSNSNTNAANMGKDVGKVVCVETSEGKRKASRDSNWFPGLVVAPTAQAAVRINTREECLIRSFKDGRYYTVPRKEMTEFKRDGATTRVDSPPLAEAVDKALNYLDNAELPQHWDKDVLFGLHLGDFDSDENYSDSSDDEPREEKDHFVAQLYKFMDDRGTPLNKGPIICNRDVDLYRFFRIVEKLGGYNSVTNKNRWRAVTLRIGFIKNSATTLNLVKQAYFRFLFPFEEFNRKLGCTMISHPRSVKKNRGRSLIRDKDRATPIQIASASPKPEHKTEDSNDTITSEKEKKEEVVVVEKEEPTKKKIKPQIKEETIVKIKKEPEVTTDSSGSEGILDVISDSVPTVSLKKNNQESIASTSQKSVKKQTENKSTPSTSTKRSKVPGEKVKALVEKFEEQAKLDDDEKVQQTRSKSTASSRKDSAISPERKGRDSKNLTQENTAIKPSNSATGSKPQRSNRPSADEEKKRGRKRKEPDDKTQFSDSSMSDPPSVTVTNVNIGDKLKVYYGPNLESKVTYEAKVLEIERDDAGPIYLVHYTGWNNRYDEWIKPHRIAENISQTSKGKRPSKTASVKNNTTTNPNAGKRGRGASVSSRNTSENQGPPPNQVRSTTPSSVTSTSSRTKSPATPAARAPSARLAKQAESVTKRSLSVNNGNQSTTRQSSTASDSDSGNSDSEDSPKRRPLKRKEETPERTIDEESLSERPKRARKTPKKSLIETVSVVTTTTTTTTTSPSKTTTSSTTVTPTSTEVTEPKGRDYDLNQIRSELKGFEKALKLNSPTSTNAPSNEETPKVIVEPTKSILTKPPTEEVKKKEKSPEKEIKEKEIKIATDDIYEFKEPEPLELESRASSKLNDDKTTKKRRLLEDLDKPIEKISPIKKKLPVRTPPKSDNKLSDKSRFRRNLSKKSEDSESSSPESKSPAYTTEKSSTIESPSPSDNVKPPRILYASEEAFDKLVISPCFNIKTSTTTASKSPIPPPIESKVKLEEIETKIIKADVIIEDIKITTEENLITSVVNDIKESSSLENSDDDDPIHEAIRGIAESKDDEDSSDQLLISQTFTPKILEPKKELCPIIKDIVDIKPPVVIPVTPEIDVVVPTTTTTTTTTSSCDISEKPIIIIPEQEVKVEIEVKPPPSSSEPEKSITQKVKQISPALQETDSSLLEAAINQQTPELSSTENIIIPKRTGPRIASSILQKFNAIKKKEENPSPVKSDTTVSDIEETKSPVKLLIDEPEIPIKTEIKEEDTPSPSSSRRIASKKNLSREFIDSDDTDSDSDSEERLVIARSDDESQTSQPESTTSNTPADNKPTIESVKDTDSNASALRINTEESSQESKSKTYTFDESPIIEESKVPEEKVKTEEEPDSNISLLLCEETIPGSPAPVTETVQGNIPEVRTKPKSAKSLVLEIPFASAPGTSKTLLSEQLKHSGVVKIDSSKPSTTTVSNIQSSSVNTNILSSNITTNICSTNSGNVLPTPIVTSSGIKPLVTEIVKEDIEEPHHPSTVNSPPTTPESSISNLSPRGENGGSSSGTADESVKSQRGSEASEAEPFRAVRINKPQHYSEEDTLLNSEATPVERIKKASPRLINEDSESAIPTTTVTSAPIVVTSRKRRKSFKGDDAPANPPVGAKRGRKPNALKNLRNLTSNIPSSTNSDSDDTSEHSSATSANTVPIGPSSGSNTGPELRLQSGHHNSLHRISKYNFIVELDADMDASQRIALLQQRISDLRKAYSNEKNDLACIERRLKKIRRREREALKAAKQEIACS